MLESINAHARWYAAYLDRLDRIVRNLLVSALYFSSFYICFWAAAAAFAVDLHAGAAAAAAAIVAAAAVAAVAAVAAAAAAAAAATIVVAAVVAP